MTNVSVITTVITMASANFDRAPPGVLAGGGAGGVERQVRISYHLRILRSDGNPDGSAPTPVALAKHRRDANALGRSDSARTL
jgi:hypothetical protein